MRNLRIISCQEANIQDDLPLTATAWDTSNDSIICAFGPTPTKPIIELKRKIKNESREAHDGQAETSSFVPITSWDSPCPIPDLACDEIILMHYFSDTLTACLVMAGGDLIYIREEPDSTQEKIEIVGSIDVGITAAAWAPDQELLAIVTRADNLVLMNRDPDLIKELAMTAEDLQASKHVSVGWGKKETQFQGKRAKAMRDPTMPEHVDEGIPSSHEYGKCSVSWRGDGQYLAVNAVVPGHRRVIRVYSREGNLDSVSEPVDGLESALSWRPSGNLIASIKRIEKGNEVQLEVVFFERNGLRHGEFSLRLKPSQTDRTTEQISLSWNVDSTVLAVSLAGTVQYWTMGNYHYYLKQEMNISNNVHDRSADVIWHPEKPLKCCASHAESMTEFEFLLSASRGSTIQPNDYGAAAVIDGAVLKLTPLKHAGVPPPMSYSEIAADSNIVDVALSKNGEHLALLTQTSIEFYKWQMQSTDRGKLRHTTYTQKLKTIQLDVGNDFLTRLRYTQIVFQSDEKVFLLALTPQGSKIFCVKLDSSWNEQVAIQNNDEFHPTIDTINLQGNIQNLLTDGHQDFSWAQTPETMLPIPEPNESGSMTTEILQGGQPNSAIFRLRSDSSHGVTNGYGSTFHKISLTSKGSLLADQRVLARDCTSFILTDLYLIYTTAQHLLKFVHLTTPNEMQVPGDTPEIDERCRSIERGAKIVTVIPSIYAVVLQMPRGNLETIYPRVLVLTGIRESLRNLEYRVSFIACQNHQVDMNILHDYLPDLFMANVGKFIEDLKKPSRVDEFLSKLKEEDVTQTLYKDTLNASSSYTSMQPTHSVDVLSIPARRAGADKVNTICDAFVSILKSKPGKFLQCIITAHVCKRPPDLTAALSLVSSLRQDTPDEADLAVSHLCFLTDTNRLYDAALGLYDLELALLVAQNAQRDPREYMPFLQNLQSLPLLRRQYQIDNHLRNYSKALTSLHALEAHDEVETFTIKHTLYTHAMDLYKYNPAQLSKITTLYASHLSTQSQHSSAAILYESLGLYDEAYPLYALAHQWRESLTCATLAGLPKDKLNDLALSLATTCTEETRDYRSAATIHTEYLHDQSTAARLLCKGSYFAEAARLLSHHNLVTELPTTIDTGLGDKFSEISELVSDCKSQLTAQVPRILELRVKKAEDPLAFYGGDAAAAAADGVDIPDNISLAPTDATTAGGQSLFTRYGGSQGSKFAGTVASNISRKTSKTKRREERKRARGKKGSVYEEEYLVASVGRLIERVNGVHEEVGRLVSGLLRRGMRERALRVGEIMGEIYKACEKARVEVWGVEEVALGAELDDAGTGGAGGEDDYRPSGADGVFWESQQNALKKKEVPVVKAWKEHVLVLR